MISFLLVYIVQWFGPATPHYTVHLSVLAGSVSSKQHWLPSTWMLFLKSQKVNVVFGLLNAIWTSSTYCLQHVYSRINMNIIIKNNFKEIWNIYLHINIFRTHYLQHFHQWGQLSLRVLSPGQCWCQCQAARPLQTPATRRQHWGTRSTPSSQWLSLLQGHM